MANVTIDGLRFWQAQESRVDSQGQVRSDAFPTTDSDETLLTGLTSVERFSYNGVTTGPRLALQSGRSSDPMTALAQWVVDAESLVNGRQGEGWNFVDEQRDREANVVLEDVSWMRGAGEVYQVDWDFAGIWGQGSMSQADSGGSSVSPGQDELIDGMEIDGVESKRVTKRQSVSTYQLAFGEKGENPVLADSGATRRILISGKATGTREEINAFDDGLLSLIGQDEVVEYQSTFPGRTVNVMIESYESVREAGVTDLGEFALELREGESQI